MTEVALFFTAIPLAAVLAMLLNELLDRRLAAVTQAVRRDTSSRLPGLLLAVLLAAPTSAPLAAQEPDRVACSTLECSLEADAEEVERLWSGAPEGATLIAQSRIPVVVETGDEADAERWLAADPQTSPARDSARDRTGADR